MTVEENIEAALLARVATLETTPALPVAWPNITFTPGTGPYLRVDHLPNATTRFLLKGSDPHLRQGILQLTVVAPLRQGPSPGTKLAGAVAAHFPADLALFSGGIKVRISKAPSIAPAMKTDVSWDVPVSVTYECFA